jgi:hypothetical protein
MVEVPEWAMALFLELAFIRWIPGSVRVAGYFTNMILIASFLGLWTGSILSKSPDRIGQTNYISLF